MKATQDERWLPVANFEGIYEVSDRGRVRSLDRALPNATFPGYFRHWRGRIMRPSTADGYSILVLCAYGQQVTVKVHRLVAQAFIGPCPDGMEVCHNNGDGTDNRVENLRYDTHSANALDVIKHGRNHNVNKTHCLRGHPYDDENTYRQPDGGRACRACKRAQSRKYLKANAQP